MLVEFVALAVVLLIPSLYFVLTLGSVQSAVFAADVIARDASRIHATVEDPQLADARTRAMAAAVLADHGLPAQDVVTITCSASPCLTPGEQVHAHVRIGVGVPGLGPVLGGPLAVGADHQVRVDEHRSLTPGTAP